MEQAKELKGGSILAAVAILCIPGLYWAFYVSGFEVADYRDVNVIGPYWRSQARFYSMFAALASWLASPAALLVATARRREMSRRGFAIALVMCAVAMMAAVHSFLGLTMIGMRP